VSSVARKFNTTIQVVRELNAVPTGTLVVGSELRVPSEAVTLPPKVVRAAALVDSRDRRGSRPHMHVVVRNGDTLWRIARRHGMDVNQLAMMNGMQPGDTLRAGQRLRLTSAAAPGATRTKLASTSTSVASSSDDRPVTHVVRKGDTLSAIARLYQVTVTQITHWNGLTDRVSIKPGQKLTIRVSSRRG
jgi:membrane-bound lytic murein transglycosylase D